MYRQRDIMHKTINALYLKAFPDTRADQVPTMHHIAAEMGCLGPEEHSNRGVCKLHESMPEGLTRMRIVGECSVCSQKWIDGEKDINGPREMVLEDSNHELLNQPQAAE